jgi:hypothetical protein
MLGSTLLEITHTPYGVVAARKAFIETSGSAWLA